MSEQHVAARIASIRREIASRQQVTGWQHPVRLIAVTKTHGSWAVAAAHAAGADGVGENRVQEALPKMADSTGVAIDWHFIGGLQQNKVRQIAGRFALIHSVDRIGLAEEISRRTLGGTVQDVLVQVNCSGEAQKGGVEPDELFRLLTQVTTLDRIRVTGLMTMAAVGADEPELRRTFGLLRRLRDEAVAAGFPLEHLSMGMSDDYAVAVEEGATMIRLGSVLFGERN